MVFNEIAIDICEGRIVSEFDLPDNDQELLRTVFIPLRTMSPEAHAELEEKSGMIYEYVRDAGLAEVKGFPQFFTMRVLTKQDVAIVKQKVVEFTQIRRQFLVKGVHNEPVQGTTPPAGQDTTQTSQEGS